MNAISRIVPVEDIEVACTIVGNGSPLMIIHGAIGLGSTYMRALDPWGRDFQLVHYDQRGSGQTPVGDVQRVSFAGALEDLDGLRAGLGLDRVTLVGHSAGAYLAALYAAAHPDATTAVVLLNPGPPLDPQLGQRFGARMNAARTASDDAARQVIEDSEEFRAGQPAALERHLLNTFTGFFRDRATIKQTSLGFTEITAANVQAAAGRMIGSLPAIDPMQQFAKIASPALVVHAALDPIPAEWSHALADTIPGADFVLVEEANHFALIEDPEPLHSAVVPWLRKKIA